MLLQRRLGGDFGEKNVEVIRGGFICEAAEIDGGKWNMIANLLPNVEDGRGIVRYKSVKVIRNDKLSSILMKAKKGVSGKIWVLYMPRLEIAKNLMQSGGRKAMKCA